MSLDWYQKRVLITGAAGFIGSELTRQLSALGASVVAVDNLVNGKAENVAGLAGVRLEVLDIRDRELMTKLMRRIHVVFHLACLGVRHSIHSPEENHQVNAGATLRLLAIARDAGVNRFIYVSSSEVYGTALWVPMTEEHPAFPMTVYGAAKLAGECYTRAYYRTYGFPTVVVRPFNSYGPNCHHEGDSGEVIPKFMLRSLTGRPLVVFGDGTQTRDFTYVSDTARGILAAGDSSTAVGETINIGSGSETSINDLAAQVAHFAQSANLTILHEEPRPGDVLRLYAQTDKARKLLGFAPEVSLKEGLLKLKSWYLNRTESLETLMQQDIIHNWNLSERVQSVS